MPGPRQVAADKPTAQVVARLAAAGVVQLVVEPSAQAAVARDHAAEDEMTSTLPSAQQHRDRLELQSGRHEFPLVEERHRLPTGVVSLSTKPCSGHLACRAAHESSTKYICRSL